MVSAYISAQSFLAIEKAREKLAVEREAAREKQRQAEERKAAQLAKREEMIRKAKFQIEQSDADIEHLTNALSEIDAMLDYLKMEQSGTTIGGKEYAKYQNKIISLENRARSAEARLAKAKHTKAEAERKLA